MTDARKALPGTDCQTESETRLRLAISIVMNSRLDDAAEDMLFQMQDYVLALQILAEEISRRQNQVVVTEAAGHGNIRCLNEQIGNLGQHLGALVSSSALAHTGAFREAISTLTHSCRQICVALLDLIYGSAGLINACPR